MYNIVIVCGGSGSAELQKGLYKVFGEDRFKLDIVINAYDNSIHNTDKVLAAIINAVHAKNVNSAVLFTSDHGEDIFDDSRGRFLHASPLPTYFQLRVPLLVWLSQSYISSYPEQSALIKTHASIPVTTNMVMFHTLLDIAGINTSFRNPAFSLCSPQFKPHRRLYVSDHNEFLPLDSCGMTPHDVLMFKKNNLRFP